MWELFWETGQPLFYLLALLEERDGEEAIPAFSEDGAEEA